MKLEVPGPDLPDDTPLEEVQFSTRIQNALSNAGFKTVAEVREASDAALFSLQNVGWKSLRQIRALGRTVQK
jgi:DNA-directed RNA polymerase alpha subunit